MYIPPVDWGLVALVEATGHSKRAWSAQRGRFGSSPAENRIRCCCVRRTRVAVRGHRSNGRRQSSRLLSVATATPTPARSVMTAPIPSSPATVAKLACAQRCGATGTVRTGSLLRLRGKTLSKADEVVFLGVAGMEDDVDAETTVRRKTSVDVRVPLGAAPGPVAIVDSNGALSAPSAGPVTLDPAAPANAPSVEIAIRAPRAYYDAATPAAATYVVHGVAPVSVGVDVVRVLDGVVITHWDIPGGGTRGRPARCVGRHCRRCGPGRRELRVPDHGRRARACERAVRVLQRSLPDSRPIAVRDRCRVVRWRAWAPGAGHVRLLRDAARRGPRRQGQSSRVITGRPAITW